MDEQPSPSPSAQQFNEPDENESPIGITNTPPAFHSLYEPNGRPSEDISPGAGMDVRGRRLSSPSSRPSTRSSPGRRNGKHITMHSPSLRPRLPDRKDRTQNSARSITEALRVARRREEQETLLEDGDQADDDGCYPPRKDSIPWQPNPHARLTVYTTIHRIRRLVIASIGKSIMRWRMVEVRANSPQTIRTVWSS